MPVIHYYELQCCRQPQRESVGTEDEFEKANRTNVVWPNCSENIISVCLGDQIRL